MELVKRFPELRPEQQRGSKPRCHLWTDGSENEIAGRLNYLVKPFGSVDKNHKWQPQGFECTEEVQLHKLNPFLCCKKRSDLEKWWLAAPGTGPNWDLVSECVLGNGKNAKPGLLLVEAKAHSTELEREGKRLKPNAKINSRLNHDRIACATYEANLGLRRLTGDPGWSLSRDNCYQLSNRFAWSWKLVDLGVPVILVYLGFLNADEMSDEGDPFPDHASWARCVKAHAAKIVPDSAWETRWTTPDGTPFVPRIMSVRQSLTAARMPH